MCKPNKSKELPVETLQELLSYNPETGLLTWKPRELKWFKTDGYCTSWNRRFADKPATIDHNAGYTAEIKIKGKKKHLGYFDDKKDAVRARQQAEIDYGFHENHGRDSITRESVLA